MDRQEPKACWSKFRCFSLSPVSELTSLFSQKKSPLDVTDDCPICVVKPTVPSRWETFVGLLKQSGINRPDQRVLDRIAERHYNGVDGAASSVNRARLFYDAIKDLPDTRTRIVLEKTLSLHINSPAFPRYKNILMAKDEEANLFVVKLLRTSFDGPPMDMQESEFRQEKLACELLGLERPPVALCPVQVIDVPYEGKLYTALKMPRFKTTVYDEPRSFHKEIRTQGPRLIAAVQYMHDRGFVHMDIKADNIFVDDNKGWVLGDFGSSKRIGERITTSNLVHYARFNLTFAEEKYDWFMLLLVLLKESMENKHDWISVLCGADGKYDAVKIKSYIDTIHDLELQQLFRDLLLLSEDCCH